MRKRIFAENIDVIFVEPESSGNIGAIARVMKNFGLSNLILVNPKAVIDNDAKAFAMHGRSVLEQIQKKPTLDDALKEIDLVIGTSAISGGDYNPLRASLSVRELNKLEIPEKGRIGIIFGRESRGLSNNELNICDFIITIPASETYPTLNVAQAAAIIFYELFNLTTNKIFQKSRLAKKQEKELIVKFFENTLSSINYPEHKRYAATRIFRNLIGRAILTGREAYSLIGVFRRIYEFAYRKQV
ncbi:MAG: RNA methyltransferase [Candidatus Odinarchaeia archaeon]